MYSAQKKFGKLFWGVNKIFSVEPTVTKFQTVKRTYVFFLILRFHKFWM